MVDETGFDSARNWVDLLGVDDDIRDDVSTGGGGDDVLELRASGTLLRVDVDNVSFALDGDDLTLGFTAAGFGVEDFGEV